MATLERDVRTPAPPMPAAQRELHRALAGGWGWSEVLPGWWTDGRTALRVFGADAVPERLEVSCGCHRYSMRGSLPACCTRHEMGWLSGVLPDGVSVAAPDCTAVLPSSCRHIELTVCAATLGHMAPRLEALAGAAPRAPLRPAEEVVALCDGSEVARLVAEDGCWLAVPAPCVALLTQRAGADALAWAPGPIEFTVTGRRRGRRVGRGAPPPIVLGLSGTEVVGLTMPCDFGGVWHADDDAAIRRVAAWGTPGSAA